MEIITLLEARASGLPFYYTGVACKHGHIAKRRTNDRTCSLCKTQRYLPYKAQHPLKPTWYSMLARCFNEHTSNYEDYGGRGITVCDRWADPENGYDNFLADMGPRPEGFSIDRIDFDGDYEPSNCRWTDSVTQCRNRRSTKLKGEDVIEAFRLRDAGLKLNEIGDLFGCTGKNIWYVLQNREKYIAAGLDCRTKAA